MRLLDRSATPFSWILGALISLALAPAASFAEEEGIAFVDVRKALFTSMEGRTAQKRFAELQEEKRSMLVPLRDELTRLGEEFERQKYVLSESALSEKRLDLMKRQRDLERDMREAEDELELEQVRLLQPVEKQVIAAIQEIGKEKGFSMILDRGAQGVVYHRDSLDITDLVVKRLNEG